MSRRRWLLVLVALSFACLAGWELARSAATSPRMDLSGQYTDHYAHMNAARLFVRYGLDLWRVPLAEELPEARGEALARQPDDVRTCKRCVFFVPGWKKPVAQSWPTVVRFYPPGDLVLVAPIAALYHFTDLSLADASRLLLVLFLACAHAGLFVMLDGLLAARGHARYAAAAAAWLATNIVLRWTLEGFYDAAIVLPLLLAWRLLGRKRALAACVAFAAAAFLHWRAFYYAPWLAAALVAIARDAQWRAWRARDWAAAALAAALLGASIGTWLLALPGLLAFRDAPSVLAVTRTHVDARAWLAFAAIGVIAAWWLAGARAWLDLATLAWIALVLANVRQSYAWYAVALVPWLAAPPREAAAGRVLAARAIVFLFLATWVHRQSGAAIDQILPTWVARAFR